VAFLGVIPSARAEGRTAYLADRLKYPPAPGQADDFRVRTNAALALGTTQDDAAVGPLCGGLNDPSEVVREAAAAALKKLGRASALDCLKRRASVETKASVKVQLQRAIDAIEASNGGGAGASSPPPKLVPNAKFYVSLSKITNNSSRSDHEVTQVIHDAIRSKLESVGGYQLAPVNESADQARATIAKRKLKGYYLSIQLEKFDYSNGNLRVRVKVAVFSYPGKDLRGEVPAGATMPGARPGDKGSEDQLMSVVAGRAAELFAQNFR
jgi:hypothetical protein